MIPGPLVVIACPKCHAPAQLPTLESGNTFGAEVWTDGYMDAPMLPTSPLALFGAALTAAELARELGRFEDVAGYMALPFPEHMDEVRRRIAELAEARDPEAARLQ